MSKKEAAQLAGISLEAIRQFEWVSELRPDLVSKMEAGELSISAAYREAISDERVPVYVRISPKAKERLKQLAGQFETTQADVIEWLVMNMGADLENDGKANTKTV